MAHLARVWPLGTIVWLLASVVGCVAGPHDPVRSLSMVAGWTKKDFVEVQKRPVSPLAEVLPTLGLARPTPSPTALAVLDRHGLTDAWRQNPDEALSELVTRARASAEPAPTARTTLTDSVEPRTQLAVAELAYQQARVAERANDPGRAFDLFVVAVAWAYDGLATGASARSAASDAYAATDPPALDRELGGYTTEATVSLYNQALESMMRLLAEARGVSVGRTYRVAVAGETIEFDVAVHGSWPDEQFETIEFVSDYRLTGLNQHHRTPGVGVPLIAVRRSGLPGATGREALESHYPPGLAFAVTAILSPRSSSDPTVAGSTTGQPGDATGVRRMTLDLVDPLRRPDMIVAGQPCPVSSDLSVPLAYYLNDPILSSPLLATFAVLNADFASNLTGLYMLEPYDPERIPVIMVHGLWSSPTTWANLVNDLQADPVLRSRYQFWFYLYPTGQPFWISGKTFRDDLTRLRNLIDPERRQRTLDQTVLIGHSMGGLVSRMLTFESGDDVWAILSDKPFESLVADEPTKAYLKSLLFFEPEPSIGRVITLGTPHHGSDFANDVTRWLGRKIFRLPEVLLAAGWTLARDNPGLFRDTRLLTVTTSIDSLSPTCPLLPVMNAKPPSVPIHTVVGVLPPRDWKTILAGEGDGVVPKSSAQLDIAVSERIVAADHSHVHQVPEAVEEVKRILRVHLTEIGRPGGRVPRSPRPRSEQAATNRSTTEYGASSTAALPAVVTLTP